MDGWKRWLWLTLERAHYAVLPTSDGWEQDTANGDKPKLQCPICANPLKPPIFQCAAGHFACGACHGRFPNKGRCYKCAHPGGYSRNILLEDVIRSTSAEIHQAKRRQNAPCRCSEPGCAFVGSPEWFIYHLRAAHSWPVNVIDYGKACQLQLPASTPRCVLVAKEDMRVFVLSVAALPRGSVSLVCLRANAAARPRYTCKMWATAGSAAAATVPAVWVEMEVPSSVAAGEAVATEAEDESEDTEAEDEAAPLVPRKMLHEPSSKELHLIVRIDKVET